MRVLDVWVNTVNIIQNIEHSSRLLALRVTCVTANNGLPRSIMVLNRISKDKHSDPINRERESRLISIQRPKRRFRILLNCEKQQFVSYTSNLLEQMYDFQKRIMFHKKWNSDLQDLAQYRSLETVPVNIIWQYYPHDNNFCIHKYDEFLKSIDSGVCHKPWSILWWIVRACSLTIKYRVVQYVPSKSFSEQFESISLTSLQQISFLLLWNDGRQDRVDTF